jgi:ribosomal protein S13
MTKPSFKVKPTTDRGNVKGDFVVQLPPQIITTTKGLKPGHYVLIQKTHDNRKFKTMALLQKNEDVPVGEIRIDQKIRNAVGARVGDEVEISVNKNINKKRWLRWVRRCLDNQVNIARVKHATLTDMEINVCRITQETMMGIGVEEGDIITIESTAGEMRIRILELSAEQIETRREIEKTLTHKKWNCRKVLGLQEGRKKVNDLPWIFLDLDARKELEVEPCDPVRIHRSIRHSISKKLHLLATPLILAFVGATVSFDFPPPLVLSSLSVSLSPLPEPLNCFRASAGAIVSGLFGKMTRTSVFLLVLIGSIGVIS